jgi:hypothetical protein
VQRESEEREDNSERDGDLYIERGKRQRASDRDRDTERRKRYEEEKEITKENEKERRREKRAITKNVGLCMYSGGVSLTRPFLEPNISLKQQPP